MYLVPSQIIHFGWQNNIGAHKFSSSGQKINEYRSFLPQIITQYILFKTVSEKSCKDKDLNSHTSLTCNTDH